MDKDNNGLHLSQSGYEKELLERWNVGGGSEFPMFKLSEADFETVESVDAGVLKEAQALAGGLLWLSTKSRPDLSYGVSTMSRLMTRNPPKSFGCRPCVVAIPQIQPGRSSLHPGHCQGWLGRKRTVEDSKKQSQH